MIQVSGNQKKKQMVESETTKMHKKTRNDSQYHTKNWKNKSFFGNISNQSWTLSQRCHFNKNLSFFLIFSLCCIFPRVYESKLDLSEIFSGIEKNYLPHLIAGFD